MRPIVVALAALLTPAGLTAQQPPADPLGREVYAELIAIDSSTPEGARRASEAMAARLRAAGFPAGDVQIVGPPGADGNLVAYYRGSDPQARPLLLMSHIDVVPARRDDWTYDPFTLTERDGYFFGRGTADNKAGVATLVTNFIRLRGEGFTPARDLILVATADEETSQDGIQWLLAHQPGVASAALALNTDAGGGELRGESYAVMWVQASEKVYQSYRLVVRNPGGHSSRPAPDNAIYRLAAALGRLEQHRFPVQLNEVTRTDFRRSAQLGGPDAADMAAVARGTRADAAAAERLSANPVLNAQLRTTCVATMLEAGHAENALPQRAAATVNCRVLPGESVDEVDRALRRVVADTAVAITRHRAGAQPALAPHAGGDGALRASHGAPLSRSGGDSEHVLGRHRRALRAQRRHSRLRNLGDLLSPGNVGRARRERARAGAKLLRGARLLERPAAGVRGRLAKPRRRSHRYL